MNVKPPKLAEWFASLFIRSGNRHTLIGDLAEEYQDICIQRGKLKADLWYTGQIFLSLLNFIKKSVVPTERPFAISTIPVFSLGISSPL